MSSPFGRIVFSSLKSLLKTCARGSADRPRSGACRSQSVAVGSSWAIPDFSTYGQPTAYIQRQYGLSLRAFACLCAMSLRCANALSKILCVEFEPLQNLHKSCRSLMSLSMLKPELRSKNMSSRLKVSLAHPTSFKTACNWPGAFPSSTSCWAAMTACVILFKCSMHWERALRPLLSQWISKSTCECTVQTQPPSNFKCEEKEENQWVKFFQAATITLPLQKGKSSGTSAVTIHSYLQGCKQIRGPVSWGLLSRKGVGRQGTCTSMTAVSISLQWAIQMKKLPSRCSPQFPDWQWLPSPHTTLSGPGFLLSDVSSHGGTCSWVGHQCDIKSHTFHAKIARARSRRPFCGGLFHGMHCKVELWSTFWFFFLRGRSRADPGSWSDSCSSSRSPLSSRAAFIGSSRRFSRSCSNWASSCSSSSTLATATLPEEVAKQKCSNICIGLSVYLLESTCLLIWYLKRCVYRFVIILMWRFPCLFVLKPLYRDI